MLSINPRFELAHLGPPHTCSLCQASCTSLSSNFVISSSVASSNRRSLSCAEASSAFSKSCLSQAQPCWLKRSNSGRGTRQWCRMERRRFFNRVPDQCYPALSWPAHPLRLRPGLPDSRQKVGRGSSARTRESTLSVLILASAIAPVRKGLPTRSPGQSAVRSRLPPRC
jgi:hypothetical protein